MIMYKIACRCRARRVQASARGSQGLVVRRFQKPWTEFGNALDSHSWVGSNESHARETVEGARSPLKDFATLLMALDPVSAFFHPGAVACCPQTQTGATRANSASRSAQSNIAMVQEAAVAAMATSERAQRVKNILIDKEILNVLSSCEFAMCIDTTAVEGESAAKIDYTSLIARIDRSLDILQLRALGKTNEEDVLVERLLKTKRELSDYMDTLKNGGLPDWDGCSVGEVSEAPTEPAEAESVNISEVRSSLPSLNFVVREDGSVDWNEVLADSREVARFGRELWERLNGKEEEADIAQLFGIGQNQSEVLTDEVQRLREVASKASESLSLMLERETSTKEQLREATSDGRPLSSQDLAQLRRIDEKLGELRKLVTISNLNLDMERICVYLEQELEEAGSAAMDLKLVVAEVNLIERQLKSVLGGLGSEDLEQALQGDEPNLLLSLVDDTELELISEKVDDLKSRLGVLGSVAAPIDWGSVGDELKKTRDKFSEGLSFYSLGTQILFSDLQYCLKLFAKALTGDTLKAREVNSLRRTVKDVFTLVPVTIILIIPLTPVGHVLVFSFIQRFFPDFFPSCYTEKRLNLNRLYSEVLSKSEEALLGKSRRALSLPGIGQLFGAKKNGA